MTEQTGPDDFPTVPNILGGPAGAPPPPPGFWDELRAGPPAVAPAVPAWSATDWYGPDARQYPPTGYPEQAPVGIVITGTAPDRGARRRSAFLAVAGVMLATAVVVLATVVIGPHLGSADNRQTDNVAPPVTPSPTSAAQTDESTSATPRSDTSAGPSLSVDPPIASSPHHTSTAKPSKTTTTKASGGGHGTTKQAVPAGGGTKTNSGGGTGTGHPSTTTSTRTSASVVISTIQPTTTSQPQPPAPPPTPTSQAGQADLGVPGREIPCSNGLIVQLASELNADSFRSRVSALKGQGLVPGDAAAATSGGSCGIFSNQSNTYILYSGPFGDLRDACQDRLSGPYDAYIKGGNPGTAGSFFSCICPARSHDLPTIAGGQTGQWVGELQRMLGAHLRYSVGGLDNSSWGVYTGATRAAVQRFQSDHHLKADGVVDAKTWAAIQSAGC